MSIYEWLRLWLQQIPNLWSRKRKHDEIDEIVEEDKKGGEDEDYSISKLHDDQNQAKEHRLLLVHPVEQMKNSEKIIQICDSPP